MGLLDKLKRELKRAEDQVKRAGSSFEDKLKSEVLDPLSDLEDIVTGKTPDSVSEAMATYEAQVQQQREEQAAVQAEKQKAQELKAERRASIGERRVASRRRARRAGRRGLISGGRLGTPEEQGKRTLG